MSRSSVPPTSLRPVVPPYPPAVPEAVLPRRAERWTALTRYQMYRVYVRFAAYQRAHPEPPLLEQICGFFAPLTPRMEKTAYVALKARYKREPDWDEIPRKPVRRDEARLHRTLLDTATDRARLDAVLQSLEERALIGLAYSLRRAEITRARWGDVVLARALIYVPRGKGDKSSWAMLTPQAVADLRTLYEAAGRPGPDALILEALGRWPAWAARRPPGPVSPNTINRRIRAILTRAGLYHPGRSTHAFRRTLATLYLRENVGDLRGLQKLLRHENLATTCLCDFPQPADLAPRLARAFGNGNGGDHAL